MGHDSTFLVSNDYLGQYLLISPLHTYQSLVSRMVPYLQWFHPLNKILLVFTGGEKKNILIYNIKKATQRFKYRRQNKLSNGKATVNTSSNVSPIEHLPSLKYEKKITESISTSTRSLESTPKPVQIIIWALDWLNSYWVLGLSDPVDSSAS